MRQASGLWRLFRRGIFWGLVVKVEGVDGRQNLRRSWATARHLIVDWIMPSGDCLIIVCRTRLKAARCPVNGAC